MKYFITDYLTKQAKNSLKRLGLFCYDLRDCDDNPRNFATIENVVIVNRGGSIITNEKLQLGNEYPTDFIDFKEFSVSNEEVSTITELSSKIKKSEVLDLYNAEDINLEFYDLFCDDGNFEELNKMSFIEKRNYIINYYDNSNDIILIEKGSFMYNKITLGNNDKYKERGKGLCK